MGVAGPPVPPSSTAQRSPLRWGDLGLLAAVAVGNALFWTITRAGMRGHTDSDVYQGVVANLLDGRGLSTPFSSRLYPVDVLQSLHDLPAVPLRLYPPLYPLLLTVPRLLGADGGSSGRIIAAVALTALIVGVYATVRWATGSRLVAALVAGFMALAPPVLAASAQVMSDLPYAALVVVALGLLARVVSDGERPIRLGLLWLATAAAVLTRFAGVALPVTVALVAIGTSAPLATRLRRAVIWSGPAFVGAGVWQWFVRDGGAASVSYHPNWPAAWKDFRFAVSGWWLPGSPSRVGTVVGTVVVLVVLVLLNAGPTADRRVRVSRATAWTYVACHLAIVLASKTFIGWLIPLNTRMLLPVFVLVSMQTAISVHDRWARPASASVVSALGYASAVVMMALAMLIVNPWRPAFAWRDFHATSTADALRAGLRPAAPDPLAPYVERLPAGTLLFSTEPEELWNATKRPVLALPMSVDEAAGRRNARYAMQMERVARLLRTAPSAGAAIYWSPLVRERLEHDAPPCAKIAYDDAQLLLYGRACAAVPERYRTGTPAVAAGRHRGSGRSTLGRAIPSGHNERSTQA